MSQDGRIIVRSAAEIFGPLFQPVESWATWFGVVLPILFGLPIDSTKLATFQKATGRTALFTGPLTEAWFACGRRSGKSRFLSMLAVLLALFRDYRPFVAPGERPTVMILAVDQSQAQVIFSYAKALIQETPMLADMLERDTADTLELKNGVAIEVHVSSYKSVRGRTLVAALADEVSFWKSDDSRNPAEAVLKALRPALSTIPGAPLICASSTYTQDGALYDAFQRHHGKDASSVMVWKTDTLTMNPTFRKDLIDQAYAEDAKAAAAEFGSEWLVDVRQWLPDELIDAAIMADRRSLPRSYGLEYTAFCDPSGGVSDTMALAIAHIEAGRIVVLDRLEAVSPKEVGIFKPEEVVQRFADILSAYGLSAVTGDRYGAAWVSTMFQRFGITYRPTELDKSAIYVAAQPLFSQRVVELLDLPKLAGELRRLERRARPGGRDLIDHPRGSHDDLANAVCGALVLASKLQYGGRAINQQMQPHRHRNGTEYDPIRRNEMENARLRGEAFNE